MSTNRLCLACSSTIPSTAKPSTIFIHSCCSRPICENCIKQNARLVTFCPLCEDAKAAFRKGLRDDVTRKGEVVFDVERMLEGEEEMPPSYGEVAGEEDAGVAAGMEEEKDMLPAFVLEDDEEDGDDASDGDGKGNRVGRTGLGQAKGKQSRQTPPSLLTRQASKSTPQAEIDLITPQSSSSTITASPSISFTAISPSSSRIQVDPHTNLSPSTTSSSSTDGQTVQYYLRKSDTLQSISIRFGISAHELCILNSLPRSILSTSPHLLHTRSFILIPAHAVTVQLASNPSLAQSLAGPPRRSAKDKTTRARREAEAKFRATLAKSVASAGETAADDRAARAYVGLAEDEMRFVEFGEGVGEDGLPIAYDRDDDKEKEEVDRMEMVEAQRDTARRARFEAILKHALAKWEMDSDWERAQRANGVDPSSVSMALPTATSSSSRSDIEDKERKTSSNKVSNWFARALHSERGEPSRSPSSPSAPRHVISLGTSRLKLPTHLKQTHSAHKGPVNVVRYNTTGRYILSGGSDRSIRLWNATTTSSSAGEAIKSYTEHNHEVLALDISPDNSRFVSGGGDKSVFLWDVASGNVVRRFDAGRGGKVNDVRFGGRNGSVVVTGGFDGTVRVFDLRAQGEWRPIMELKEATDAVTSLAVREDRIYSGSVDGVLRCYDLRCGQLRSDTFAAPITSVSPSKLGTSVLVATLDSTTRLLDAKDGTLLQEYTGHKHGQNRCKAMLTPEEDGVVAGDEEGNLLGWDTVSGERVDIGPKKEEGKAHTKPILWVEPNPISTLESLEMVSAGADGMAKIWSMT
ncbi:uncharacterized protein UTRI_01638_B [Ustilago trichophora]|uniref:Uncharacterized protein n=1 Tax=Ustilago trichophora TaxID=86804 RepID=A0A5C3E2F4_9BASI|nr:uncharacterized protein UTRI_01638_B [Ustilago trichophora]